MPRVLANPLRKPARRKKRILPYYTTDHNRKLPYANHLRKLSRFPHVANPLRKPQKNPTDEFIRKRWKKPRILTYCSRERRNTPSKPNSFSFDYDRNQRPFTRSVCSSCGVKKSSYLPSDWYIGKW